MRLKLSALALILIPAVFATSARAQAHSVSLAWTASTDTGVSYNIYRLSGACPSSGTSGFAKITGAPVTATTYTDNQLLPGTYCYYATSVLNGSESIPSNLAPAVVLPAAPTALSIAATI
jgi:hypothetical protein